jgi:CBS-domain-containing membrane protein
MKPNNSTAIFFAKNLYSHAAIRESIYSSFASFIAVLILLVVVHYASFGGAFSLLVLASMGASAFLLFAVPHSPMSQPWPVVGGHFLSSVIGVACAQWIDSPALATATAVAISIFAMHWLQCLHPPSAATAMIAVLGGPEIHAIGWQFCYEVVVINAGTMVLLAIMFNNLIPGRRYPLLHSHHPHHAQFTDSDLKPYAELKEDDFKWALGQIDGVIDVSTEDLVDLYEFAVEHAKNKKVTR